METIDFVQEAQQNLQEVSYAIKEGFMSKSLLSSASCAYFNLTTKEDQKMTIRLSMRGYEVPEKSFK